MSRNRSVGIAGGEIVSDIDDQPPAKTLAN